ncbi:choice-of-anchor I family protein [Cyanobium sp. WAJ14-Wanaka]|nr:choice-of-anchor I family protein [Cyanobium sp. WAJ14-Wanaka]
MSISNNAYIVSSGGGSTLQVTDASNPNSLTLLARESFGGNYVSQAVAAFGNLVAVALAPGNYSTSAGKGLVRFYKLGTDGSLSFVEDVEVGYLPDSIAFNDQGTKLVIANEGEPTINYSIDRPGSIGIIDIEGFTGRQSFSYTDLGFAGLTLPAGIRISGTAGTTQANDIEPEYVSILGNYAYVTLQENNGVAKVNLATNRIENIFALGAVDFKTQLVDLTDRDNSADNNSIFKPLLGQNYEGLRQADGIAAYRVDGKEYFVTANEGDTRDYGTFLDEVRGSGNANRVKRLTDDASVGSKDRITTFGSRSISIFDAVSGALLWDSGNSLQTIAVAAGIYDDLRSDDKGVEPEGVVVAQLNGRSYAIVSMERTTKSMLAVFDVTVPSAVSFVTSAVIAGSISPEGLEVVEARNSPTGRDQLIVSNEVSNTLNVFDLQTLIASSPVAGAGTFASTMLKDVAGGPTLKISSLITNGEFTNSTAPGSVFVPPGIFDGQGAYSNGDGTYTVLVNHEVSASAGYAYTAEGLNASVTGSRISRFIVDIDADDNAQNGFQSRIVSGDLAYDKVIGNDTDGLDRFCGANLVEANSFGAGRGFADRIFLTGEEVFGAGGGAFYALDTANSDLHQVKAFGKGTWESATAIDTGSVNTVAVLLFDDDKAPLRLWVGQKTAGGFLERNGLAEANGVLYTFVPTALAETGVDNTSGPDSDDLKALALGASLAGSWVKIEKPADKASYFDLSDAEIRNLTIGLGALQFSRIEDGEVNPLNGQQAAFNTTGTKDFSNGDLYGNVYTLSFANAFGADGRLASAGSSSLRIIYDADRLADPTTGLRNPDNLTWSADGRLYLQEDRANGGGLDIANGNFGTQEASIWKLNPSGPIDPITGALAERWAQIDRTAIPTAYGQTQPAYTNADSNGIGNWESSGIIDVSKIYGAAPGSFFLANVQAHSLGGGNINGSGYLVEGGQIDLIQQTI